VVLPQSYLVIPLPGWERVGVRVRKCFLFPPPLKALPQGEGMPF